VKPIQIVAVDDERTLVTFNVPIKGRKPLEFSVPRFDFIDEDEFDSLTTELNKLDEQEDLPARKKARLVALAMLKQFVSDQKYALLETLKVGQLDQILAGWREHSQVSLGESAASDSSSTESTEAQSASTSSEGSDTAA
jgi:hypothetical protein